MRPIGQNVFIDCNHPEFPRAEIFRPTIDHSIRIQKMLQPTSVHRFHTSTHITHMKPILHHSQRIDRATNSPRSWRSILGLGVLLALPLPLGAFDVIVTIENLAPHNGTYLTPTWMGFHNGGFDLYHVGSAATPGLESVAEDGAATTLTSEFTASGAGSHQAVTSGGPIAPGERRTGRFALDAALPSDRYFSFAAIDRKSTRLNSSHLRLSRMPSSA